MQQDEISAIIRLASSGNLTLHLRDKKEIEVKKSEIVLTDGICCTENLYIPCSEVLYISVPKIPKINLPSPLSNRMKLWKELESCGYVAMFSGRTIRIEDLNNCDLITIEHIVPIAKDGSNDIDNLTLEYKDINARKGCMMPRTYIKTLNRTEQRRYNRTVMELYRKGVISKTKYKNYMTTFK